MKERRQSTEPIWATEPVFNSETGEHVSAGISAMDHQEYGDPTPMAPPVGYEPPSNLEQMIEQLIHRRDFLAALAANDLESPEEADDFDVDEDYDPRFEETIYEKYFEAKSKRAAQVEATRKAHEERLSQKVSEGLSGSVTEERTAEKPIPDGGSDSREPLTGSEDTSPSVALRSELSRDRSGSKSRRTGDK